jgi:peroxiredoxin
MDERSGVSEKPAHEPRLRWARTWLIAAGIYNLLWGAFVVAFPNAGFRMMGLPLPAYPQIWQCVGMIVGVYGVGYLIAATNPLHHWPIVLVGLLGKIFGPIGFFMAAVQGDFPWAFGWTILTNDLLWWIPFGLVLLRARQRYLYGEGEAQRYRIESPLRAMAAMRANTGSMLAELTIQTPCLVVFLRHVGCLFCREALADLARMRDEIERCGSRIVLVHMSADETAAAFFARYDLADVPRISDPEQRLYNAFELGRGSVLQLFGLRTWRRGYAALREGHRIGRPEGDPLRMPGVFLVQNGRIKFSYRHRSAGDRPDYADIACSAIPA